MAPRAIGRPGLVTLFAALVLAVALATCGGDGEKTAAPGTLTDPSSVAVATPWAEPPQPIVLEEGAIAPLPSEGEGEGAGEGEGEGEEPAATPSVDTYIVEPGDTLYSIAEEFYGDGSLWPEIAEANGITDPGALSVGQELAIPPPPQ